MAEKRDDCPEQREAPGVAPFILEREGCPQERLLSFSQGEIAAARAQPDGNRLGEHPAGTVALGFGTLGRRLRCLCARAGIYGFAPRGGVELEREIEAVLAYDLGGAGEQCECGPTIQSVGRAPAGGG